MIWTTSRNHQVLRTSIATYQLAIRAHHTTLTLDTFRAAPVSAESSNTAVGAAVYPATHQEIPWTPVLWLWHRLRTRRAPSTHYMASTEPRLRSCSRPRVREPHASHATNIGALVGANKAFLPSANRDLYRTRRELPHTGKSATVRATVNNEKTQWTNSFLSTWLTHCLHHHPLIPVPTPPSTTTSTTMVRAPSLLHPHPVLTPQSASRTFTRAAGIAVPVAEWDSVAVSLHPARNSLCQTPADTVNAICREVK